MRVSPIVMLLGALLATSGVHGAEPTVEEFIEVPPPPPAAPLESYDEDEGSESANEPAVTIIQREGATHEEYRLNGRLYMVKVTPAIGPAYYFVDRDGDGLMETRMNDRGKQIQVPQWVIFSW